MDEITYLFLQMSPKTIVTETLRVLNAAYGAQKKTSSMKGDLRHQIIVGVEVARQAVQQLAVNTARAQEPAEVISGRCLQLEREIEALKKQMVTIQKDRDNLRVEVRSLRRELTSSKLQTGTERERRSEYEDTSVDKVAGPSHASSRSRTFSRGTEDLPPVHRLPLRGISRIILEGSSVKRKLIDEKGRIVLEAMSSEQETDRIRIPLNGSHLLDPKKISHGKSSLGREAGRRKK